MGFRHLLRIRARKLLTKKSYRWTVFLLDQIILWKANLQISLEQPVSANLLNIKNPPPSSYFRSLTIVFSWAKAVETPSCWFNPEHLVAKIDRCQRVKYDQTLNPTQANNAMRPTFLTPSLPSKVDTTTEWKAICCSLSAAEIPSEFSCRGPPAKMLRGSQPFRLTKTIVRSKKKSTQWFPSYEAVACCSHKHP